MDPLFIDICIFVIANAVNLLMAALFLCRTRRMAGTESVLGIIIVFLALPLILASLSYLLAAREWWTYVLPIPLIIFMFIELLFDYILRLDFRSTPLLWPYLLLFYLGLLMMIGYSFLIGRLYGFATLGTYFLQLLATWYSYAKVGHGEEKQQTPA